MKQIKSAGLATVGCLVAMLLTAPHAKAQPVAGTEAGAALSEANSAGIALESAVYFGGGWWSAAAVRNSPHDICLRLLAVKGSLSVLGQLYDRAILHGQTELASRLSNMGDDLADLLWEVEDDLGVGCWPPIAYAGRGEVPAGAEVLVGANIGGGFQNTNFSVSDTAFNVNGSGVMGGGFVGALFPIPNTSALMGFRFGGEGGNITGSIAGPAASPNFTYTVTTSWMAYQEGMVKIPVAGAFKIATNESPQPQDRAFLNYNYFNSNPYVTGSVGIAESGTSVKGTSGAFSVTDNMVRSGITFSVGAGTPVVTLYNGAVIELFAQYRGTQWISTVNIPGGVPIGSFTNEVDLGLQWRFWGPPPPPP
jgi:hypothetical protein